MKSSMRSQKFLARNPDMTSSTPEIKINHRAATSIGNSIFYPGYMFGLDMPCLVFQIDFDRDAEIFMKEFHTSFERVGRVMRSVAPPHDGLEMFHCDEKRVDHFLFWVRCLLANHDHLVLNLPKITRIKSKNSHSWAVIFPCLDAPPTLAAIQIGVEALNLAHSSLDTEESIKSKISDFISKNESRLKYQSLIGFNTLHFLREAHNLGIPWFRFSRSIFQLGYGKNSRLLNSSITDATPSIGVAIAKNKRQTSHRTKTLE